MRDYTTLHLDANQNKGTACSKNVYGCKWTLRDYRTSHLDTNKSKGTA